jgi:hypothetical protein
VTWSLPFGALKALSFAHSGVYVVLLVVWLLPGLHGPEFVFGLGHGVGWIAMCVLMIGALKERIVSLRLAVAVTVLGGVGPFIGSFEFVREQRRREAR